MTEIEETSVVIVGGGPVGLCLACLLALRGIACVVLERRTSPLPHSRAIGIHPPSLAVLQRIGVREELCREGITIDGGRVFYGSAPVGRIGLSRPNDLSGCPLSIPQSVTEGILERRLGVLAPAALRRGVAVTAMREDAESVTLEWQDDRGGAGSLRSRYVVGCDGKASTIRGAAKIAFGGGPYRDAFLMGDFRDDTPLGTDVLLTLSPSGIVESFPLPGGLRRWVAYMPDKDYTPTAELLSDVVYGRTGLRPSPASCLWLSPFGIEHFLAERFARGRVVLAGDAAHVVSPIGGQGMNLGILDAADLAECLHEILAGADDPATILAAYSRRRRHIARVALYRAHFNTFLGRPCPSYDPRRPLVWMMLNIPPLSNYFAHIFTMRDLEGH